MTTETSLNPCRPLTLLLLTLAALPACGFDGDASSLEGLTGFDGESGADSSAGSTGEDFGDGDGDDGVTDTGDGDPQEEDPDAPCFLDCGAGTCVWAEGLEYCECPPDSVWGPQDCGACPPVEAAGHDIQVAMVEFDGLFTFAGGSPPDSQYDDANLWLENQRSGDRVLLGNTHDGQFAVRVTPGIYDVVYEIESPGTELPHNQRAILSKLPLFESRSGELVNIPVAQLSGPITLNDELPPDNQYDDGQILFRDTRSGNEVFAGNTRMGNYSVALLPGTYDVIYRVESPGDEIPRNDGAVLFTETIEDGDRELPVNIPSVSVQGMFLINGAPAPDNQYDDGNVTLESPTHGRVALGNTHEDSYEIRVIPGTYKAFFSHESGPNVPQNAHAEFDEVVVGMGGGAKAIDIPMVQLSGALTINSAAPPGSQFDDAVLQLVGAADDTAILGNTHDGGYTVNLIPGTYDVYYSVETAGGTVPENKRARVMQGVPVELDAVMPIDVQAISVSGAFTLGGAPPPTSVYEDGRIYLRNPDTGDDVLLGSTHEGGYAAIVIPGEYEFFYVQEAGGSVPNNQNASLGGVSIGALMVHDVNVPVVDLSGQFQTALGEPAPDSPTDGGQLYLRGPDGDSVLLGDSYAPSYAARLVVGSYGIYYRSEQSSTMPQNQNGWFDCITVE